MSKLGEQCCSSLSEPSTAPTGRRVSASLHPGDGERLASLDHLAALALRLLDVDLCTVHLDPGGRTPLWGASGLDLGPDPAGGPFRSPAACRLYASSPAPVRIALDAAVPSDEPLTRAGMVSCLGVPYRVDDRTVAMVSVASRRTRPWTEEEVVLLGDLAAPLLTQLLGDDDGAVGPSADNGARAGRNHEYQVLLDAVTDLVWLKDREARVVLCNDAFARFVRRSRDQVVGRRETELFPPAVARRFQEHHRRILEDGQPRSREDSIEDRDGVHHAMRVSELPFRDSTGSVARIAMVSRPVDAERGLETRLRHAQRMEVVGGLAGGVAHDFNNILTAIHGHAALALEDCGADDPVRESLLEIERAADRAESLTRKLAAFSRSPVYDAAPIDLSLLMAELRDLLGALMGRRIAVDLQLADDLPLVDVAAAHVEQVVMNLAVNARDAMPDGGRLTIRTSAREASPDGAVALAPGLAAGSYACIAVADTGTGIPPEILPRIFEPFFTTKGDNEGTGLGLATAASIIEEAGGHVAVETDPGVGTVFTVWLPTAATAHEPGLEEDPPSRSPVPLAPSTILIVEDDDTTRQLATGTLRGKGHQVLTAATGAEGLLKAGGYEGTIDLVLTDVVMPGMDGLELARQVRALRPGVPVLMMTGYSWEVLEGDLPEPHCEFLTKPFTPASLLESVDALMERYRSADAEGSSTGYR